MIRCFCIPKKRTSFNELCIIQSPDISITMSSYWRRTRRRSACACSGYWARVDYMPLHKELDSYSVLGHGTISLSLVLDLWLSLVTSSIKGATLYLVQVNDPCSIRNSEGTSHPPVSAKLSQTSSDSGVTVIATTTLPDGSLQTITSFEVVSDGATSNATSTRPDGGRVTITSF